jgi:hypothetical protein
LCSIPQSQLIPGDIGDTLTASFPKGPRMSVAASIRKLGFRRWHERQLIEAHASLVTAFLCVIVVAVCLDQFRWREAGFKPLIMLALAAAGIALCFKTVTFYFKMLFRAEHFAQQAVCSGCKAYGVIEVLATSTPISRGAADAADSDSLHVRCKKCGHAWTMSAIQGGEPDSRRL